MKRVFVIAFLLIVSVKLFSQATTLPGATTKTGYTGKSKHQKTAAILFLGGGASLVTTAILIPPSYNYDKVGSTLMMPSPNYTFKTVLFFTGLASTVVSISFFISSAKNKKKSRSLSFTNEMAPLLLKQGFVSRPVPSLNLKINL